MQTARLVFETNFFGVMRLAQLVIPLMRSQGGGTIVNISSGTTLNPNPMLSVYGASKYAIEGFTEALKKELASFDIRVILAHPGGIRTSFAHRSAVTEPREEYRGTASEAVMNFVQSRVGKEPIDPVKAASLIVDAVDGTGMLQKLAGNDYFRLPIGQDIAKSMMEKSEELTSSLETFNEICQSADFKD